MRVECVTQNQYQTKTVLGCFHTQKYVDTKFTVKINGKPAISCQVKHLKDNGIPDIENVAKKPAFNSQGGMIYILTYFVLDFCNKGKYQTVRVSDAHAGVLGLIGKGFTSVTNNRALTNNNPRVGEELRCSNVLAARKQCWQAFTKRYPEAWVPD